MPAFALALPPTADLVPGLRVLVSLLLALAIATAVVMRLGRGRPPSALQMQVTSWWFLLPPVFLAWALRPLGALVLVFVISALAARELAGLSDRSTMKSLRWRFALLAILQMALCALGLALWNIGPMLAFAAVDLYRWHASAGARRGSLLQAIFAAQAAGLWCLVAMAADWFLYLCIVTALNDIGQFSIGKAFGRHKLAARISPNKTWQGVAGGLMISVSVSLMVGTALGLAALPWLFAMGLALSVAGLLGDLMFSAGKRRLGIKDYGRLIPGHGGILDRVDSLVLTAPVMLLALQA